MKITRVKFAINRQVVQPTARRLQRRHLTNEEHLKTRMTSHCTPLLKWESDLW